MNRYIFDEPLTYKKLVFHPARIRDYYLFVTMASCLYLDRTSHTDPIMAMKAISMTYLDYLFFSATEENNLLVLLVALLQYVLRGDINSTMDIRYRDSESGKKELIIEGDVYTSSDFDIIRQIIAEQNGLELPNEKIQKSVREDLEKAQDYKRKLAGYSIADLEEQMIALSLYSGWDLEYIYSMTFRKFFMAIKRANHMINSNITLNASMSGFVTFKDKKATRGWLADLSGDDKYGDVKLDPEQLQKKVSFEEAKSK